MGHDADGAFTPDPPETPDRAPDHGPSVPARRIVAVVLVAVVVLAGLAYWALVVPYRVSVLEATTLDCDARVEWTADAAGRAAADEFTRSCDDAKSDRRRTALLLGAGVATAAAAVSTLPSRRLTGIRLGAPD